MSISLLGIPDTSFKGLSTLTARSVRKSTELEVAVIVINLRGEITLMLGMQGRKSEAKGLNSKGRLIL